MSNFNQQTAVLREVEKARNAVKRKYNLLKSYKLEAEKTLNDSFKPVVEPLEKLINVTAKSERKIKHERSPTPPPPTIQSPKKYEKKEVDDVSGESDFESATSDMEFDKTVRENIPDYIQLLLNGNVQTLDVTYGVRKMRDNSLKIGSSDITFKDNNIIISGKKYQSTPGLMELLFLKEPHDNLITDDDLKNYAKILKDTNAYRKYYDSREPIRENTSKKYKNYVSKVLKIYNRKSGTGLPLPFKIARRDAHNIDYVYWDDPNELVERLKLLMAETTAGNNNHANEIQSIIEELREAEIIY